MWHLFLDVLRDPLWQSLFGLISVLVAILLFIADRQRKELSFLSIWSLGDSVSLNDGKVLTRRFVVRVINTGRVPILPDDFERPVVLSVPGCQILDASIADTKPPSIHPRAAIDNGEIVLFPLLLNPGDSITFEVISTFVGFRQLVCIDGRIAGVKNIRRLGRRLGCVVSGLVSLGALLIIGPILLVVWFIESGYANWASIFEDYYFYAATVGFMIILVALFGPPWMRVIMRERLKSHFRMLKWLHGVLVSESSRWRREGPQAGAQRIERFGED